MNIPSNLPSVRGTAPTLLVAGVLLVTVELLRAANPLLDLAAADVGVVGAAGLAAVIFAAPALVGLVVAAGGAVRATLGMVAGLVLLRLVAQAQSPPTLLVVGAGAAAGIAALVLAVRHAVGSGSGASATIGVLVGTVADLAVRAAYSSWDPVARPGVLPWLVTLAVCAATVAALLAGRPSRASAGTGTVARLSGGSAGNGTLTRLSGGSARGAGALGPYLALYVMGYGSAPALAAHAGVPLPAASAVLIAVAVAGVELVRRVRLPASGTGVVAAVAAVGGIAAGYWLTGPGALAGVVVAGLSAAVLLARALTPRPVAVPDGDPPSAPAGRFASAALAAGLGYVLPVLVYQVHYELELPFDNRLALVAAAGLLGLAGSGRRGAGPDLPGAGPDRTGWSARPAAVSGVAALALLVPLSVGVTRPAVPAPDQTGGTVRLMSWNVMYGRHHPGGVADPESIAAAIEAADPDLVLLQEVSRGWPIGGGVDLLEWLSRRLGMRYEWAPAADGQFGNALLTRLPRSGVRAVRLPFVQGPMERSYLTATLRLDSGRELIVINAHLQHRKENTATRLVQIQALLDRWDGNPGTVIAGDFNFWPSWPERRLWDGAGLVSAQDLTGHGAEFTVPSDDPDNRVDWIFGTPDLAFSDFAILDGVTSSDHFPLVVTVELG